MPITKCPTAEQQSAGLFYCTRNEGHSGPCAAVPVDIAPFDVPLFEQREKEEADARVLWSVRVLDHYAFMHPTAGGLAPFYDIGLGWGIGPHAYFAGQYWSTPDEARAKAAAAIEAGEV